MNLPATLGALKKGGYALRSIKEEMRDNLIRSIREGNEVFEGIRGYESTVIPQLQNAILSKHNIILLGLRGQAKTRIARLMIGLLDEYIPIIEGSEINDDPMNPLSRYAKDLVAEKGDQTPITWLHRNDRYTEKLATPDVSVADLIGDADPIKAAALKLPYSDERVIHYGLIPRSNRGLFVINELPDLQARIQVSLFNILQEGDIQIRGFKLRMPLDIQFVFTANPEDYTNRGSIVTPLKDRIDSQILTHYPRSIDTAQTITEQEAHVHPELLANIYCAPILKRIIERVAFEARESEYVDKKSGVSARLTISAYENLFSSAYRRMLMQKKEKEFIRISDLMGIVPNITGKVELVYEGEVEGVANVAQNLIGKAIRSEFLVHFPDPNKLAKTKQRANGPYEGIVNWFNNNTLFLNPDLTHEQYLDRLNSINGLKEIVKEHIKGLNETDHYIMMEFVLHGLAEFNKLSKFVSDTEIKFSDLMNSMLNVQLSENDPDEKDF
jgi:magnesium chelatase subunit I